MKKLIPIALFFIAFYCSANDGKNDLSVDIIKVNVKYIKETEYEAIERFGEIEKGVFYLQRKYFTIIKEL